MAKAHTFQVGEGGDVEISDYKNPLSLLAVDIVDEIHIYTQYIYSPWDLVVIEVHKVDSVLLTMFAWSTSLAR